jgi:hypothetical protein
MKMRNVIIFIGGVILVIVWSCFTLSKFYPQETLRIIAAMLVAVGLVSLFGFIALGVSETDQELSDADIRLAIVVSLITLYIALVGAVSTFSPTESAKELPEITTLMINHFTTIIGVAIAFYFGTEAYMAVHKKSSGESDSPDSSPVKTPAVKEVKKT